MTRPGREFENRPTFGKIIRIYQELLDRIDKTVSRVTVWRHKALQSDAYQWPVAQICLSIPATHDRISFFEVT